MHTTEEEESLNAKEVTDAKKLKKSTKENKNSQQECDAESLSLDELAESY